jgi:hypothetical protein
MFSVAERSSNSARRDQEQVKTAVSSRQTGFFKTLWQSFGGDFKKSQRFLRRVYEISSGGNPAYDTCTFGTQSWAGTEAVLHNFLPTSQ